jgi:Fur family ferric uptake transcriptional regulator
MESLHQQEKKQFFRLFEKEGIDRIDDRMAILSVFLDVERHVTFEELLDLLRQNGLHPEPDFVKKTLSLLCRYGFAAKKEFKGQPTRYEHRHLGRHHDHLICTKCNKIVEFENQQLETMQLDIAASYGFHVLQHRMEIYGLCGDCLKDRTCLMSLANAHEGELGIVEECYGGSGAQLRLATLGMRKGDEVEVITNSGSGQLIVAVNNTRLAIGRGVASKVLVKPNGCRKVPK